jgi:hypothetical protein
VTIFLAGGKIAIMESAGKTAETLIPNHVFDKVQIGTLTGNLELCKSPALK